MNQRHQSNDESSLSEQEQRVKQQLEEERRVSQVIEEYLKNHYEKLAGQVDHWMIRHEQDLDMKGRDLQQLKVCSGLRGIIVTCSENNGTTRDKSSISSNSQKRVNFLFLGLSEI